VWPWLTPVIMDMVTEAMVTEPMVTEAMDIMVTMAREMPSQLL